jgi:hypothetical protein
VVGCVLAGGGLDHLDVGGDALKRLGYLLGVLATGIVPVRNDHDLGPSERVGVFGPPFEGSARVAGRGETEFLERVNVPLALGDVDPFTSLDGLQDAGKAIQHPAGIAQPPLPAADTIGTALAEVLRREPDYLEKQLAALVGVVVGVNDLAVTVAVLGEQVAHLKAGVRHHLFGGASGLAVQQPTLRCERNRE